MKIAGGMKIETIENPFLSPQPDVDRPTSTACEWCDMVIGEDSLTCFLLSVNDILLRNPIMF
jgi:hypothetical protein